MVKIWYTVVGDSERYTTTAPTWEKFAQAVKDREIIPLEPRPADDGGIYSPALLNGAQVVHFGLMREDD